MRGTITFFIDRSARGDRRFIRNQLRIALRSRASVNQTSSEIFGLFSRTNPTAIWFFYVSRFPRPVSKRECESQHKAHTQKQMETRVRAQRHREKFVNG